MITFPDDVVTAEWGEYRVLCASGVEHQYQETTKRHEVMRNVDKLNTYDCGPHTIQQRLVAKIAAPWGDLLATDPQTEAQQSYEALAQTIPCTRCEAEPGQPCANLAVRRSTGERVAVLHPHVERLNALETHRAKGEECPTPS